MTCYRGSEHDVLDRYYMAARAEKAAQIVRITADCPLIDPEVIDRVVRRFQRGDVDYATNAMVRTYPDGLGYGSFFVFGAGACLA